jgi:hypothetical protein
MKMKEIRKEKKALKRKLEQVDNKVSNAQSKVFVIEDNIRSDSERFQVYLKQIIKI